MSETTTDTPEDTAFWNAEYLKEAALRDSTVQMHLRAGYSLEAIIQILVDQKEELRKELQELHQRNFHPPLIKL